MSGVFLDYKKIYVYLNSVRTSINADVIGDITLGWGMSDNKPIDRVASTGWLKFSLKDNLGHYTPDNSNVTAGWGVGIPVELEIAYFSVVRLFRFYIKFIEPPTKTGDITTRVTCYDWLDYAADHPIVNPGIQTNQRGDQVLTTTLGLMPITPLSTAFDTGSEIFPTAFDTVTSKTHAYDEALKVALSELGRVYLQKIGTYGEILVFESLYHRTGLAVLDTAETSPTASGVLNKEDGFHLLLEGGTDKLLLNQEQSLFFDNSMMDYEAVYGEDTINRFTITANPRRIDTSAQILFKLDTSAVFVIASGKTVTLKGTYADPAGGLPINGQNMITPVITTDYLMNTVSDGSGTDISTDLAISITYGTEGFTAQLTNNNSSSGWITKFNTRGYGIYIYNPIEYTASDTNSINTYGAHSQSLDQSYKNTLYTSSIFADVVVDDSKDPRTLLKKIIYCPNRSDVLMQFFLKTDVGHIVQIKIDTLGINGYYYIQGIEEIAIGTGGFVMVTYLVKEFLTLALGLTPISLEFHDGSTDAVSFGYLPQTTNLAFKSWCAWIYVTAYPSTTNRVIFGNFADNAGASIFLTTDGRIEYYSKEFTTIGIWHSPLNSIPLNTWTHICIEKAQNLAAPTMYINGVGVTVTNTETPSGTYQDEIGTAFMIGNWKTATQNYTRPFVGSVKDVRVYNRYLSTAELALIYNSGTPSAAISGVTDKSLVFQAYVIKTRQASKYIGHNLDNSSLKVKDTILGVLGTPNGAPSASAY